MCHCQIYSIFQFSAHVVSIESTDNHGNPTPVRMEAVGIGEMACCLCSYHIPFHVKVTPKPGKRYVKYTIPHKHNRTENGKGLEWEIDREGHDPLSRFPFSASRFPLFDRTR